MKNQVQCREIALQRARTDGNKIAHIAKEIGTTGQNISSIISRKSAHSPYAKALDQWLKQNGYWPDDDTEVVPAPPQRTEHDGVSILAAELRALLAVLESGLPKEIKLARFRSFLETYGTDEVLSIFA